MGVCYEPHLFLSGLPIGVSLNTLREMFSRAGCHAEFINIVRNSHGKQMPRAIAFVRLLNSSDIEQAREKLHRVVMEGHEISVKKYSEQHRQKQGACYHGQPNKVWQAHVEGRTSEIEAAR